MRRRAALFLGLALVGCRSQPTVGGSERRPPPAAGPAHAIVVCGEEFAVDAPVVRWFEPPGYDAYRTEARFRERGVEGLRYRPGRAPRDESLAARVADDGWTLDALRDQVDLFVLHYDVCGTSRTCFDVLHDRRGLSVHFLLDVDGTLYQTLDLVDQAWHARQANPRSIGIEIAHVGAYPPDDPGPLDEWYAEDEQGLALTIPERLGDGGVRTPGFRGRPARPAPIRGTIQGDTWTQPDFTPEQYASLVALTRTLAEVFPRLALDAPRDAAGNVRPDVLSDAEFAAFRGVLGHYHVSADKRDPGPAFDWERFLAAVRARP